MSDAPLWKLPHGWCWTDVGSIVEDVSAGKSFKCDERPPEDGEVGVVKVSAVTWGTYDERESKTCTRPELVNPQLFVRQGDFLFSRANTIELVGACVIAENVTRNVMLSDKILRFDVRPDWKRWLLWSLRSSHGRAEIERLATGNQDSMRNIGQERALAIRVPVPPNGEQVRILEAIESYFTRLDDAVATLERVERNLKRYRASVLKAAVEGRLVPTEAVLAKQEGRSYEPASVLLDRILTERRRRWSESGKKGRYEEPVPPDITNLPDLPEGWCWATLDQLSFLIRNGRSTAPTEEGKVPILRIGAVRAMSVDLNDVRYLPGSADEYADDLVDVGDLLFTRYNGTPSLVGVCGLVKHLSRVTAHPDKLIKVRIYSEWLLAAYVELAANAGESRRHVTSRIRTTAGQAGVSGSDLRQMPVPIAPLEEQRRIAGEVERLWQGSLVASDGASANRLRAHRLRQAILKWAFEGRLADQDPADDHATVLLQRIKAERERATLIKPPGSSRTAKKKQVRA